MILGVPILKHFRVVPYSKAGWQYIEMYTYTLRVNLKCIYGNLVDFHGRLFPSVSIKGSKEMLAKF